MCAFVWLYECIYGMYNYVYMYVCVCQYTLYLCRWTYVTCIARITYMTYTKCKTHMLDEVQRNIAFHFITLDYIILLVLSRGEWSTITGNNHPIPSCPTFRTSSLYFFTQHYITLPCVTKHVTAPGTHYIRYISNAAVCPEIHPFEIKERMMRQNTWSHGQNWW